MFLKIDGIQGESQDAKHPGEIELLGFSWSESQAGTFAHGGGGGAGKVRMEDLRFIMTVNRASPKLMLACATGDHLKQAVLTCRKAGKEQLDFLKVTLTDLLVSRFGLAGSDPSGLSLPDTTGLSLPDAGSPAFTIPAGGSWSGPGPVNSVSLNFAIVEIEYKEQKADGTLGAGSRVKYDLKKMQAG
jgi:type VI secretion system secreted protein Hcp